MRISKATDKGDHRMWVWFGERDVLTLERGRLLPMDFGFSLRIEMDDVTLGLYLGIVDFYISLRWQPIVDLLGKHPNYRFKHTVYRGTPEEKVEEGAYWEERNIGFRLDIREMTLSANWWTNLDGNPRSRHLYWFLQDKIFGRAEYSEKILEEGEVSIDMPEGIYKATFKRFISYWKRPRMFGVKSLHRMSFDIPVGIPHEGKGENSWDMGMDATFGTTFPTEENANVHQEARKFALRMLEERQRHGKLSSPDYSTWKLAGENRVAMKKLDEDILNVAGVPDEAKGSSLNSSASEAKLQKEVDYGKKN